MKIFQNKTVLVVLFSVLTVLAVVGIIYGVASHSEPGLMENTPGWVRSDFPLDSLHLSLKQLDNKVHAGRSALALPELLERLAARDVSPHDRPNSNERL